MSGWVTPLIPNLADFTSFVRDSMQIPVEYLPDGSPWLGYAFNQALGTVINVPGLDMGVAYTLAVYNLGGHTLIKITPDQPGRTFFQDLRKQYGLNGGGIVTGLVQSTSDEGTSTTLSISDSIKNLTLGDLQLLKTPWGLEYMAYAVDFGGIVGLS